VLHHTFLPQVSTIDVSPDGKLMAWTEDTAGAEKYTLRVKVGLPAAGLARARA
jgi:protease II